MKMDQAKVLDAVSESLRTITSVRDFVTAVEVGAKIAGECSTRSSVICLTPSLT